MPLFRFSRNQMQTWEHGWLEAASHNRCLRRRKSPRAGVSMTSESMTFHFNRAKLNWPLAVLGCIGGWKTPFQPKNVRFWGPIYIYVCLGCGDGIFYIMIHHVIYCNLPMFFSYGSKLWWCVAISNPCSCTVRFRGPADPIMNSSCTHDSPIFWCRSYSKYTIIDQLQATWNQNCFKPQVESHRFFRFLQFWKMGWFRPPELDRCLIGS